MIIGGTVRFVVITLEVEVVAMVGCEVVVIASVMVKDAETMMHVTMMMSLNYALVASRLTYCR